MSQAREPGMPKDRKSSVGSSKWTKYQPAPRESKVSWDEVSQPQIGEIVGAVTRDGSGILFSTTRDGGALVITICAGDERIKFYATTPEETATMLARVLAAATD